MNFDVFTLSASDVYRRHEVAPTEAAKTCKYSCKLVNITFYFK